MECNYYPLIALTATKKDMVDFTLEDGPCPVDEEHFVLLNRPGTPILSYATVLRGMDIPGVFEGDIISFEGTDYIVKYQRGFNAISIDKSKIITLENITAENVKTHMFFQRSFDWIEPATIKFRVNQNKFFTFQNIYGYFDGRLLFTDSKLCKQKEIIAQQDAGVTYQGKKACFGKNPFGTVKLVKGKIEIEERR